MPYRGFKDLTGRTATDKISLEKAFNIAKKPIKDSYERELASIFHTFYDKNTSCWTVKNENISNKELAEELHKPIIRKFNKSKVHSPFTDNIWGADLAYKQLIRTFEKGFRF